MTYSLAYKFANGDVEAPITRGGITLMPAKVKSGRAVSIHRGIAHTVKAAAVVTGPEGAALVARWACGGRSVNAAPVPPKSSHAVCSGCAEASLLPRGPVVYRCYDAEDGELIYIGSTVDLFTRVRAHRSGTAWWEEVGEVKAESYPTESAARAAESQAIAAETPYYNRRGLPPHVQAT